MKKWKLYKNSNNENMIKQKLINRNLNDGARKDIRLENENYPTV